MLAARVEDSAKVRVQTIFIGPGDDEAVEHDPLLGRRVEVRSVAGIAYYGVVRAIRRSGGLGELFELGSDDAGYQRLVYVRDRADQVKESAAERSA
jgi:hypothetical protein